MQQDKPKRHRRTEEELLRDLEAQLARLREKAEARKQREEPIIKSTAKLVKSVRKYAQEAQDAGRTDLSLSAQAFAAGLERAAAQPPAEERGRRSRGGDPDAEQS